MNVVPAAAAQHVAVLAPQTAPVPRAGGERVGRAEVGRPLQIDELVPVVALLFVQHVRRAAGELLGGLFRAARRLRYDPVRLGARGRRARHGHDP